jgi:hypothetical protein
MVSTEQFIRVSQGLKQAYAALHAAALPYAQRQRWQRRLIAITDTATRDLGGAEAELQQFQADWARITKR